MASITLSGVLLDPNSDFAVGDQIRFTHNSTTGQTVAGAVSIVTVLPNGSYSFPLQYGLVLVEYKDARNQTFKNLGVATVNATNTATSIPELLTALVPVSSTELIAFQAILADAVAAKVAAEAAAATLDKRVIPFETITGAITETDTSLIFNGGVVEIKDKGSGLFDVVLASSVTANARTIIACAGIATLALTERPKTKTQEALIWQVNPSLGSDVFGNGVTTGAGAFKTIQYAYDQLPSIILHQQTIQLSNGTYNESFVPAANQTRPAILWGRGKITTFRSTLSGGVLTGAIVIKGNSADRTAVKIKTTSAFKYGIYVNKGNIGLQHLSIESDGVNTADALLVAHRTDVYLHCDNVLIDGIDASGSKRASIGVVAESGGQVELANRCELRNCNTGPSIITSGSSVTISGNSSIHSCGTGASNDSGYLKMHMTDGSLTTSQMIYNCTSAIRSKGGFIEVRGFNATHRATIDSPVELESTDFICVFADTTKLVAASNNSSVKMDSSNYQDQISLKSSTLLLRNSNSYVMASSPNNDNAIPVLSSYRSAIEYEGTNNLVGSGGGPASKGPRSLQYSANSQIQPIFDDTDIYRINGTGANRTACEIEVAGIEDGRTITIDGDTWGVEFTSGSNMDIPVNFTVGNGTGHYSGATLVMRASKWRVLGLGQVRP